MFGSSTSGKNVFTTVTGKSGNAVAMTQDASFANYPIIKLGSGEYGLTGASGMAIEMWIKPTGHSTTSSDNLLSRVTGSATGCTYNANSGYSLKLNTSGTLVFALNGGAATATTSTPIADNAWHHVVATYDKVDMKIYVDNVEAASTAYAASVVEPVASFTGTGVTATSCSNFKLGGSTTTAGTNTGNFQGVIDEFRLYNQGLTAAQVSARFALFP